MTKAGPNNGNQLLQRRVGDGPEQAQETQADNEDQSDHDGVAESVEGQREGPAPGFTDPRRVGGVLNGVEHGLILRLISPPIPSAVGSVNGFVQEVHAGERGPKNDDRDGNNEQK
jgi:hypothetical protein